MEFTLSHPGASTNVANSQLPIRTTTGEEHIPEQTLEATPLAPDRHSSPEIPSEFFYDLSKLTLGGSASAHEALGTLPISGCLFHQRPT
jgi:hypothetical protein